MTVTVQPIKMVTLRAMTVTLAPRIFAMPVPVQTTPSPILPPAMMEIAVRRMQCVQPASAAVERMLSTVPFAMTETLVPTLMSVLTVYAPEPQWLTLPLAVTATPVTVMKFVPLVSASQEHRLTVMTAVSAPLMAAIRPQDA